MALDTPRLKLVPCLPAHLVALVDEPGRFEQVAGFAVAPGLRDMYASGEVSAEWMAALRASDVADPWRHGFFLILREGGAAIGAAGFKGPPDAMGMVEIAYGVAPSFEGQGYATEAAAGLVAFALETPQVELILAHTLPVANASTRVLAKCGFQFVGEVVDPEDGLVWRWERGR
jgi:[ribosomal protein S5]-alanine N-acetyltransferase